MPTYLWLASIGFVFIVPLALLIGLAYVNGFADGNAHGGNRGEVFGSTQACSRLAHQVNWAVNTDADLVASGHETQVQANKVKAAEVAAYAYACGPWPIPSADPYMPGTAPPVALNSKPTLPVASTPTKIPCLLTAKFCPA